MNGRFLLRYNYCEPELTVAPNKSGMLVIDTDLTQI